MKLYCFYLPVSEDYKFKEYSYISELKTVMINNKLHYLYAWTNEKEQMLEFINQRDMAKFKCKKFSIDDTELDNIELIHGTAEINYHTITSKDGEKSILMTGFEYDIIIDGVSTIIFDTIIEPDIFLMSERINLLNAQYTHFLKVLDFDFILQYLFQIEECLFDREQKKTWDYFEVFLTIFGELFT